MPETPPESDPSRQVPLVYQECDRDCGPACVAMLALWHGQSVTLQDVRAHCPASPLGTSARALLHAARALGLSAQAYRAAALSDIPAAWLPLIAHCTPPHFVVIEGWNQDYVRVADPCHGRERLARAVFEGCYTGIVLRITPPQ